MYILNQEHTKLIEVIATGGLAMKMSTLFLNRVKNAITYPFDKLFVLIEKYGDPAHNTLSILIRLSIIIAICIYITGPLLKMLAS